MSWPRPMKRQKMQIKNKATQFVQDLLGLILSISVDIFLIPSGAKDIGFFLFKKKSDAEIISIKSGGTEDRPFMVKVKYYAEREITDVIFVDKKFRERLAVGGSEEGLYFNGLGKKTYFLDYQFPRIGSVFVGFVSSITLLFLIYTYIRRCFLAYWHRVHYQE